MICVKCGKDAVDTPFCPFCGWKQTEEPRRRRRRSNGEDYVYKRADRGTVLLSYRAIRSMMDLLVTGMIHRTEYDVKTKEPSPCLESYAPDVMVLEPEKLREEVKEEAEKTWKAYSENRDELTNELSE